MEVTLWKGKKKKDGGIKNVTAARRDHTTMG